MTLAIPPCLWCRHLQQAGRMRVWTCAAFLDGIPEPILAAEVVHDKPYPGDHDIQFAPKPGYDAQGRRVSAEGA